jgi:hypothetical protein
MKKEIIIAIIVSVILGGSYIYIQSEKQDSIERQHRATLELEQEKLKQAMYEKDYRESKYQECLVYAEKDYMKYLELNGIKNQDGTVTADLKVFDRAEKNRNQAQLVCNQQWK